MDDMLDRRESNRNIDHVIYAFRYDAVEVDGEIYPRPRNDTTYSPMIWIKDDDCKRHNHQYCQLSGGMAWGVNSIETANKVWYKDNPITWEPDLLL